MLARKETQATESGCVFFVLFACFYEGPE